MMNLKAYPRIICNQRILPKRNGDLFEWYCKRYIVIKTFVPRKVEEILNTGTFATTTLRAGIIVGSGSASFDIIQV
jgi:hypothetical protein